MAKLMGLILLCATAGAAVAAAADESPVDRWARAVGGRDNVAAVTSVYREGTLTFAGMTGSIKVWRTADGKYRKEEQVGPYSSVETFDGTNGSVQQGSTPARAVTGTELAVFLSKSFANWSAVFFVFLDKRHLSPSLSSICLRT